jgi:hypothetical protein
MNKAVRQYMREIGAKGNEAIKGTQQAKLRASKAARAKWANHTPGHVREMFRDAIEAFVNWDSGNPEPTVTYEVQYEPREITISQACGLLWNCKDVLPRGDYDRLSSCDIEPRSQTYASAARAILMYIKNHPN